MSTEIEDVGYNGLIGSMDLLTLEILDSSHHDNPFLYKIFTNDLLYSLIYDASSAKSLVCLLRTCQAVRATVQEYIQRVFRIDPLLSRYFTDVLAFRYLCQDPIPELRRETTPEKSGARRRRSS